MRILGAAFVRALRRAACSTSIRRCCRRIPGLHTHRRALADGVRIHGCTVHFVTPELDDGPIVAQGAVPVRDDDDEATLAARVLAVEHVLLPAAVRWFCEGRLVIAGRRVRVKGSRTPADAGTLRVPRPAHPGSVTRGPIR